jgi:chromate transport protein ChrA
VIRVAKWLGIGLATAAPAYAAIAGTERLILSATESGSLPATVGLVAALTVAVLLTTAAVVVVGERTQRGHISAVIGTIIAYLVGSAPLAALSVGLAAGVLGERVERNRAMLSTPSRPRPRGPRSSRRRRR